MSVRLAISTLGLRARTGPGGSGSGVFRYVHPEDIEFRFDGAGIDREGELVVVEEESGPITSLHIYGHLARLLVMAVLGDPVAAVGWVVEERHLENLRRVIRPWYNLASRFSKVSIPRPYYMSTEGEIL